jgi:hypothetical protein
MLAEFVQTIAEAYSNFFIWAFAGAASAEIWLLLGAFAIGVIVFVLPLAVPAYFLSAGRAVRVAERLSPLVLVVGLFITLILGISGNMHFQSHFRECVQIEEQHVSIPQPIMVRMCRDRNNINDEFSEWYFAQAQVGQKYYNTPTVEQRPEN